MVKKYFDFILELSIDGVDCPPETASPLFQRDPFPGGHRYSCVLSGARLGKYFNYLPIGRRERVSLDEARQFFTALELQWDEKDCVPQYFLNSIDELDFDGQRINFSGVCSPVTSVNRDA